MSIAIKRLSNVGRAKDYLELTKPKVVALLVLTAWVGMMLAVPGLPDLLTVLAATVGIGLLSAAAAAINHVVDQRIDAQMARTYSRPVAKGRLSSKQATSFAFTLAITGFIMLYGLVNALTAWLTLASLFGKAGDATKYCYWWLSRCHAATARLGGDYRQCRQSCFTAGDDYLYLDAAAFLGAGDSPA
jgi:protoheme IX farnesyltransferase